MYMYVQIFTSLDDKQRFLVIFPNMFFSLEIERIINHRLLVVADRLLILSINNTSWMCVNSKEKAPKSL